MRVQTRFSRSALTIGRSVCRAAEWVSDGVAKWKHDHAPLIRAAQSPEGVPVHVAAAGVVGVVSLALDVATGPVGPVVALGGEAATLCIATHAVSSIARERGFSNDEERTMLASAITHVESNALCSTYAAEAWRTICRIQTAPRDACPERSRRDRARRAARALLRDGARAIAAAAVAAALVKIGLKKAPWVGTAIRLSRLPYSALEGARLVSAVKSHAEQVASRQRSRVPVRPNKGATPASAASTVEPLLMTAATPGVIRPSAPSPIATAFGTTTSPSPRRTLAIA
jgi:hypothetical protein